MKTLVKIVLIILAILFTGSTISIITESTQLNPQKN